MNPRTKARLFVLPVVVALAGVAGLMVWAESWTVRGFGAGAVALVEWPIVQLLLKPGV